ncbi:hypothetical protein AAHH67_26160 [Niallia circulans]
MKAEISWSKRKRGVHQLDESRNLVEQEKSGVHQLDESRNPVEEEKKRRSSVG